MSWNIAAAKGREWITENVMSSCVNIIVSNVIDLPKT